jgi:iron(III) transport system substrate-binding protein
MRRDDLEHLLSGAPDAFRPSPKTARSSRQSAWSGPNQKSWGTHINISGAGVLKTAPNKDAALKFMEYLASDEAQAYFANGNNEWPVVKGAVVRNPELDALGKFKADTLPIGQLAKNTALAQKIFDRAGFR